MNKINTLIAVTAAFAGFALSSTANAQDEGMTKTAMAKAMGTTSTRFKGVEVNRGTVTMTTKNGKRILTLSKDFRIPNTPAPHWQLVDGSGNVYLLKQLKIAGNKKNLSIEIPSYVTDIAKVQIWCSFAEVVLGEAGFDTMK
jgi:hypothetical protein